MTRLGLLGGTFDPIHCGHLDAARAAQRALQLDLVHFVPAHIPPHRPRVPVASAFDRFAMTAIALVDDEGFVASDRELKRSGPSFSTDTIAALHEEGWERSQLFFITGVDAFAEIATWHRYPALLDDSHFIVVTRPGYEIAQVRGRLPSLAPRLVEIEDDQAILEAPRGTTAIFLVRAATTHVSSTEIRRRIAEHEPLDGLVPRRVSQYIRQHRLYEPLPRAPQLHGQI
jgi:nicotinate-nucleotide adenylyltransferase